MRRFLLACAPHSVALILYSTLACLATWPLVLHTTTHFPAVSNELSQDLWQNVWNVWWVQQALFVYHTTPYHTPVLFYPQGASLALHTLNLPLALVGLPLLPVLGMVATYNLLTLLALVLVGYCTFVLARFQTAHTPSALVAGAVVMLAPQRLNEMRLAQLPTVCDYGVPLALLGVLLALKHQTWRTAMLAAAGLLLAGLSSWYHLFHLLIVLAVLLVWHLCNRQHMFGEHVAFRAWVRIAVLGVLLAAPFLLPAVQEAATASYAQKGGDLVSSADLLQLLPQTLSGAWRHTPPDWTGHALFGLVPVLLALVGLVLAPRHTMLWAVAAVVCLVLMLGPRISVGGSDTGIPLPYALVRALPVVGTFRAPLRINATITLLLALMAAPGLARLAERLNPSFVWGGAGLLLVLIALEAVRLPFPLVSAAVSPVYQQIAAQPGAWSVLELPLDRPERLLKEMYAQTYHHKFILTGQTSRSVPRLPYESAPPLAQVEATSTRADIVTMTTAERDNLLRGLRVYYLVIHADPLHPARAAQQAATARQVLGPLTEVYHDESVSAYRLDEVAPWLDGAGAASTVELPLYLGLDDAWEPPEETRSGLARWLPFGGAGLWTYTQHPRRAVLELTLYSLPGERPLELWLNGQHVQTLPIPAGLTPRRYTSSPLALPAGPSRIELRAPQEGISPRAVGVGDDTRPLSFSIHHAALREVK